MRTERYIISNLRLWRVRLMLPSPGVRIETAGTLKIHSGLQSYTIFHIFTTGFLRIQLIILTAVCPTRQSREYFACAGELS